MASSGMAEPPRKRQRRHLNFNKCKFCRKAKKACTPVERTWPQKCQRCIELELECSENSRAAGAPTLIPVQPNNQAIDLDIIRNLSLRLAWLARLKFYHKAVEVVWDTQERLFSGWRRSVGVQQRYAFIEDHEISLFDNLSKMIFSTNPLAAFIAQAFNTEFTPGQQCPLDHPLIAAAELQVGHFRETGDINTALAMEEIALLHKLDPVPLRNKAARLLNYCNIYQETIERLETILGRKVPTVPPLHYFSLLTKERKIAPPFTPAHSHFISKKDFFGRSLSHMILDLGIKAGVESLIWLEVARTSGDDWGRWPIHIACSGKSEAVVKYVLNNTTDCDVEDCLGRSALHYASSCGSENIVRLLLDRGASARHKDQDQQEPMSWAVKHGHTAVVKLLLKSGADISAQDDYGNVALITAATEGYMDIVQLLLKNGAIVDKEVNFNHQTALFGAAGNGHVDIVQLLLENGASVNKKDDDGRTALLSAARKGRVGAVEVLLRYGASINEKDDDGETALFQAARNGHVGVVRVLLRNGADANEKNDVGQTVSSLAVMKRQQAIAEMLRQDGAHTLSSMKSGIVRGLA